MSKKITIDNYYEPCDVIKHLSKLNFETGKEELVTEKDYIEAVKDIYLNDTVPKDIRQIFEPVTALYVYGYLYWTFFTLANEQALKAWEAAISEKYRLEGGKEFDKNGRSTKLFYKINFLLRKNKLNKSKEHQYTALRLIRNSSFHPGFQQEIGHDISVIKLIADEINLLFK